MTPPRSRDRDVYVPKHVSPEAAPDAEWPDEENSKAYSVPERRGFRAKRPTDKRIERLEEKHDALDEKVDAIHGDVREMRGELKALPELVGMLKQQQEDALDARKHTRERWTKVIAGVFSAGVLGAILHAVMS